jgi:CubicO group peptidase (beta-lactamase class C family)
MTVNASRIFARPGISRGYIRLVALLIPVYAIAAAGQQEQSKPPAKQWPAATPAAVGLDAAALGALDADLASGKYGLVDSTLVIRCGKLAFEHAYTRDYGKIYGERAKKTGPLNHDLHGPYNYFSTEFHPYYRHSDLHTMQSVSKTVTSITMGVAMQRGEFKADLDAPILQYFDGYKIANLDDRKRRITLRNLLTMSAGLEWHEDLAYDDPKNSADVMEATRDWVQYVIDQPMVSEPGEKFVYNSGVTELLAYIFKKVTGKNVDQYAAEYLFTTLDIRYFWKHSPTGLPDTEGGLYLAPRDLARIGLLILHRGVWEARQIVPADWIKQSVTPAISVGEDGWEYGFQWWLMPYGKSKEKLAWGAHGFGGQMMIIVPEYDLIAVFTGWDILPSSEKHKRDQFERILASVDAQFRCGPVDVQSGN